MAPLETTSYTQCLELAGLCARGSVPAALLEQAVFDTAGTVGVVTHYRPYAAAADVLASDPEAVSSVDGLSYVDRQKVIEALLAKQARLDAKEGIQPPLNAFKRARTTFSQLEAEF